MNLDKPNDQEKTKRIKILGKEELSAIYDLPQFNEDEQKHFFSVSSEEKMCLETFHSLPSRIYFVLQLGYFKSHRMFFSFDYKKMIRDIRYIKNRYFPQSSSAIPVNYKINIELVAFEKLGFFWQGSI